MKIYLTIYLKICKIISNQNVSSMKNTPVEKPTEVQPNMYYMTMAGHKQTSLPTEIVERTEKLVLKKRQKQ